MYLINANQTYSIPAESKTTGHNLSSSHMALCIRESSLRYVHVCSLWDYVHHLVLPLSYLTLGIQSCRHKLGRGEYTLNYSIDMLLESTDE